MHTHMKTSYKMAEEPDENLSSSIDKLLLSQ